MLAPLLLLMLLSRWMINLQQTQKNYSEMIHQLNSYLCFKRLTTTTKKYLKKMHTFNTFIGLSFKTSSFSPQTRAIWIGLKQAQLSHHLKTLFSLKQEKFCTLHQTLNYTKKIPFGFVLTRSFDGRALLKRKRWSANIHILKKKKLKANYEYRNKKWTIKYAATKEDKLH